MVRQLGIPFAVAVNRCDMGDDGVVRYCRGENIPILLEIPNDRRIAEAYSRGDMMVNVMTAYRQKFIRLFESIVSLQIAGKETA